MGVRHPKPAVLREELMIRLETLITLVLVVTLARAQDKGVKTFKLRIVTVEERDDPNPISATSVDDKGAKLVLFTARPVFRVTGEDSSNRLVLSCEWPKSYTHPPAKPDDVVPWCPRFFHVGQLVTFQKAPGGWAAIEAKGVEGVTESAMPRDKQLPFQIVEEAPVGTKPCR
jgi:hypothetical protein